MFKVEMQLFLGSIRASMMRLLNSEPFNVKSILVTMNRISTSTVFWSKRPGGHFMLMKCSRLNDYVPPEYRKDKKAVGKQLFIEHRKLQGMTTINAKYRYVQLCRSLKTYGVTFFLVKVRWHVYLCSNFRRKRSRKK